MYMVVFGGSAFDSSSATSGTKLLNDVQVGALAGDVALGLSSFGLEVWRCGGVLWWCGVYAVGEQQHLCKITSGTTVINNVLMVLLARYKM